MQAHACITSAVQTLVRCSAKLALSLGHSHIFNVALSNTWEWPTDEASVKSVPSKCQGCIRDFFLEGKSITWSVQKFLPFTS